MNINYEAFFKNDKEDCVIPKYNDYPCINSGMSILFNEIYKQNPSVYLIVANDAASFLTAITQLKKQKEQFIDFNQELSVL